MPHPLPHLMGLAGLSGSGKDLVAALLTMLGYQYLSFAQELRQELESSAKSSTPPPPELLSLPPTHPARLGWLRMLNNPKALYTKPTEPPIRALLQWYGTDYRRHQDDSYWISKWHNSYQVIQSLSQSLGQTPFQPIPIVVPDVRFPNEAQTIQSLNGQIILITNPNLAKSSNHSSENPSLLSPYLSTTLSNSGTQTQLATQLLQYLYNTPNPHTHIWSSHSYQPMVDSI